jgi:hypothetical protein
MAQFCGTYKDGFFLYLYREENQCVDGIANIDLHI